MVFSGCPIPSSCCRGGAFACDDGDLCRCGCAWSVVRLGKVVGLGKGEVGEFRHLRGVGSTVFYKGNLIILKKPLVL